MSTIDNLKGGDFIDLTSPRAAAASNKVRVNTTGGSKRKVSDTTKQEKINISDIVGPEPRESEVREDLHNSVEEDILDLTNPNSPFSQYINDKKQEYTKRMAEYDEEVAAAKEDEELENESMEIDDTVKVTGRKVMTEELVLDDLVPTEEEDVETEEASVEAVEDLDSFLEDDSEDDLDYKDDEEEEDIPTETVDVLSQEEDDAAEEPEPVQVDEAPKNVEKPSIKATDVKIGMSSVKSDVEFEDEEDDDEEDEENDEILTKLKKMATERLKPKANLIDISQFKVSKAKVTNVNPILNVKESKVAKWVLPTQKQIVLMREFSGSELQTFVETAGQNTVSNMTRRYRLIYNHIESPKPDSFEAWLKATPFADLDHYFFAVYVASFNGANYIPADCPNDKCEDKTFVSEDVSIMDMVKFESDERRNTFRKIYKEEEVNIDHVGLYPTAQIPVTENIAISFKEPTLYSYIEARNLDEAFRRKYSNIVDIVAYIDDVFFIDNVNQLLCPIEYKEFAGNSVKTFKSKIRKYASIFNTFTADEYSSITAYISDLNKNDTLMSYVTPKLTCPCCGSVTEETDVSAEGLVFTRYQLGALVNTTLN